MVAKKGNNYGRQFSKTNQPRNNGRKLSRLNEFSNAFKLDDEDRKLSREDTFKLLEHLLSCSKADIEVMVRDPDLPIAIVCQIKAIVDDLSKRKCDTIFKLYDRLYGKTHQRIEHTETTRKPLISNKPMSRIDYLKLLQKLMCESE